MYYFGSASDSAPKGVLALEYWSVTKPLMNPKKGLASVVCHDLACARALCVFDCSYVLEYCSVTENLMNPKKGLASVVCTI